MRKLALASALVAAAVIHNPGLASAYDTDGPPQLSVTFTDPKWLLGNFSFPGLPDLTPKVHATDAESGIKIKVWETDDIWSDNRLQKLRFWLPPGFSLNPDFLAGFVSKLGALSPGETYSQKIGSFEFDTWWGCDDTTGDLVLVSSPEKPLPALSAKVTSECWASDADAIEGLETTFGTDYEGATATYNAGSDDSSLYYGGSFDPVTVEPGRLFVEISGLPTDEWFDDFEIEITAPILVTAPTCGDFNSTAFFTSDEGVTTADSSGWTLNEHCPLPEELDGAGKPKQAFSPSSVGAKTEATVSVFDNGLPGWIKTVETSAPKDLQVDLGQLTSSCSLEDATQNKCPPGAKLGTGKYRLDGTIADHEGVIYLAAGKDAPDAFATLYSVVENPTLKIVQTKNKSKFPKFPSFSLVPTTVVYVVPTNIYYGKSTGYAIKTKTEIPKHLKLVKIEQKIGAGLMQTKNSPLRMPSDCAKRSASVKVTSTKGGSDKTIMPVEVTGCSAVNPKFSSTLAWAQPKQAPSLGAAHQLTLKEEPFTATWKSLDFSWPKGYRFDPQRLVGQGKKTVADVEAWLPGNSGPFTGQLIYKNSSLGKSDKSLELEGELVGSVLGSELALPLSGELKLSPSGRAKIVLARTAPLSLTKLKLTTDDKLVVSAHQCGSYSAEYSIGTFEAKIPVKDGPLSGKLSGSPGQCAAVGKKLTPQLDSLELPDPVVAGAPLAGTDQITVKRAAADHGTLTGFELRLPVGMSLEPHKLAKCSKGQALDGACEPIDEQIASVELVSQLADGLPERKYVGGLWLAQEKPAVGRLGRFYLNLSGDKYYDPPLVEGEAWLDGEGRIRVSFALPTGANARSVSVTFANSTLRAQTSCQPRDALVSLTGWDGDLSPVEPGVGELTDQIKAEGCTTLPFAPSFSVDLTGASPMLDPKVAAAKSLPATIKLSQPGGQAATSVFTAALDDDFSLIEDDGKPTCEPTAPKAECVIGTASLTSPILPPLTGPNGYLAGSIYRTTSGNGVNAVALLSGSAELKVPISITKQRSGDALTLEAELPELPVTQFKLALGSGVLTTPAKCNTDEDGKLIGGASYASTAYFQAFEPSLFSELTGSPIKINANCPLPASQLAGGAQTVGQLSAAAVSKYGKTKTDPLS